MLINENASVSGELAKANTKEQPNANTTTTAVNSNKLADACFPYYTTHQTKSPAKFISMTDIAEAVTFRGPRIGSKDSAPLITPFNGNGKTKDVAMVSDFNALVIDHDKDDKSRDEIRAVYGQLDIAYFAFTTSTHLQGEVKANHWKVLIPLADAVGYTAYIDLAQGAALLLGTDRAQSRLTQGFYAPNVLTADAPFDCIDATDRPLLNASDTSSTFIAACLTAYKSHQDAQGAKAKKATPKPRTGDQVGIIGKVCQQYDLVGELQARGYKRVGGKLLSPTSTSGSAAIVILESDVDGKTRCYSHHGEADPLSHLNNDGHSLDVFDVICLLDHGGDLSRAVGVYADKVDPEGQKQRQREFTATAKKNTASDARAARKTSAEVEYEANLPPFPDELSDLPNGLGELQSYVFGTMIYPSPEAAGFTALAIYTSLAQTYLTINSMGGLGFNEQYMMLGGTGSGKEGTRKPFSKIHHALGYSARAGGGPQILRSAPSSKQGLHKHLEDDGNSLVLLSDEFGEWLCTTETGSHKQEALGYLMEIYSSATESVHPGGSAHTQYKPVDNPRVTLYTTSTAERMIETMTESQADSGSYNRFVIMAMGKDAIEKRYEGFQHEISQRCMAPLEWLISQRGTVDISPDGWERFKALDQAEAEPIKRSDSQMGGRLGEQAIKLAGLAALADMRMTISADDMDIGFALRIGLYKRTKALFVNEGAISSQHVTTKAADQIRTVLERKGSLYRSHLPAYSRQYKKLSVAEQNAVVMSLIEDGSMNLAIDSKARFTSNLYDS